MKLWLSAFLLLVTSMPMMAHEEDSEAPPPAPLGETVVKMELEEGVDFETAIESMKLRANLLNMPLVSELPLSEQLEAMGQESNRMEIFQFCDPLTARDMVEENIDFAAFLPCRIALIEDQDGQGWLVMADLDRILAGADLPPELQEEAMEVRDALEQIMEAGAQGDL